LQLLHAARAFLRSRYPVDLRQGFQTLLPHLSKLKKAVSLLTAEAVLNAADGKTEEATEALVAAGHVADSVVEEPRLISQLLRIACWHIIETRFERVLSLGLATFTDKQLAVLQELFREGKKPQCLLRGLVGEQANGVAFFCRHDQLTELLRGNGAPS